MAGAGAGRRAIFATGLLVAVIVHLAVHTGSGGYALREFGNFFARRRHPIYIHYKEDCLNSLHLKIFSFV